MTKPASTAPRPGTPSRLPPGASQFASGGTAPANPSHTLPCTSPDGTSGHPVTPTVSREPKPRPPEKLPLLPNVPCTRACSPHTPPGTPPRRSPSLAATTGTSSADSIPETRPEDSTSSSALTITEEYIMGINQIDLGPRVNDLSKM